MIVQPKDSYQNLEKFPQDLRNREGKRSCLKSALCTHVERVGKGLIPQMFALGTSKITDFFPPRACTSHLSCLRQNLTTADATDAAGIDAFREASRKEWGCRLSPVVFWGIICPSLLSGAAGGCPVFTCSLVQRIVRSFYHVVVVW